MGDNFSGELIKQIEINLKKAIHEAFDDTNIMDNCEQVIVQKVNSKIKSLARKDDGLFSFPQQAEIIGISYNPVICNNGVMTGKIIVKHCEKQDIQKYGGPGFPGKKDGQLCEYPKGSKKFYKWDNYFCKWENIYHSIHGDNDSQSWSDKLTNNAAFEPWWGSNNSGGNYLRSDRHRNGADELWHDPVVRNYMGTFKEISSDVMQSIYRFTLNLKSAIGHYEKLTDVFGFGDEENNSTISNNNEVYKAEEEPKIPITIERLHRWHMWESNGSIQQSGMSVRKDTAVYPSTVKSIQERIKAANQKVIDKENERFKNNN